MTQQNNYNLFAPSDEHEMLRQMVRDFAVKELEPQALASDRKEIFNLPLFRALGPLGLLGLTVDEEYGGAGQDALGAVIVHEELSSVDPGFCLAYLSHALLCVNNLARNGSEAQKKKWLPKLCSGEWIGAMAMSEPHVGTDVLGMKTSAVKKGDRYILNGRKMWITNGTIDDSGTPADIVWVYARTGESNGRPLLSTFVVERGAPGFSVGQKIHDKTGMRASNTAELVFQDCAVPVENLIGAEGESMTHMMRNLEIERLGLAAMSLGMARRSLQIMVRYASEREAFGQHLLEFGQVQKHIGDSYAEYMAASSYVYNTARNLKLDSAGQRVNSDGAKLFSATMAKNVADRAMQVLGGYGYVGEYVVERLWRDAKLIEIGGGTLEAHQKNIVRELKKNPELMDRTKRGHL
jgi:isovaleryl-CoA dehydrogenase